MQYVKEFISPNHHHDDRPPSKLRSELRMTVPLVFMHMRRSEPAIMILYEYYMTEA